MNSLRQHWHWQSGLLLAALCASTSLGADGRPAHAAGSLELLKPPADGADRTKAPKDRLVVFYFGSPGCGNCSVSETVEAVRKIKREVPARYPNFFVKCVGVCPDEDFGAATEFLAQYGAWDEVQIGGGAYAEFCLRERWAGAKSGGIPRIMVFRDQDSYDAQRAHGTVKRWLVGDYALGSQLKEWIEGGYPLLRLGPWEGEMRPDGEREWRVEEFFGRWRVEKAREPALAAEVLELSIGPTGQSASPKIEAFEDGAVGHFIFADVAFSTTGRLTFVSKGTDLDWSIPGDTTLSLDGRSLWMRLFRQPDHPFCMRLDKVE